MNDEQYRQPAVDALNGYLEQFTPESTERGAIIILSMMGAVVRYLRVLMGDRGTAEYLRAVADHIDEAATPAEQQARDNRKWFLDTWRGCARRTGWMRRDGKIF